MPVPTQEVEMVPAGSQALAPAGETSMAALFERLATDPNASVEKIERLMALWERNEARRAKAEFSAAMADAQKKMRPVAADADNPQTKSRYASYAALDRALRPIYTDHGFGLSFDTGEAVAPDQVRVLCYVTHAGGHDHTYHIDMPADGKGAKGGDVMTKTHATGAGVTYGMRYLLKMIFNVAVGEDDNDGNAAAASKATAPVTVPAGFEDWLADLSAVADEGWPALQRAWDASAAPLRKYLGATSKNTIENLKRKAKAVSAKAGQ